eukprot:CAMPEP_0170592858 /NCGR_PEP_ID=MMETSP0224-20130122/13143_1 /TAXON_ID=285029 /ORGANISM="Togula jolla, Strain CCCM 725" /LENGTH=470 /DNA_ID=CAMNT_0010916781 /DNA_START=67 /DNA_END=1476 /DNA_ORIENTATION=+
MASQGQSLRPLRVPLLCTPIASKLCAANGENKPESEEIVFSPRVLACFGCGPNSTTPTPIPEEEEHDDDNFEAGPVLDRAPSVTKEEDQQVDEIQKAMKAGLLLKARRRLARLGADAEYSPERTAKIHRICNLFQETQADLSSAGEGWVKEKISDDLEYSYNLSGGKCCLLAIGKFVGGDSLKALSALVEGDLSKGYKKNVTSAEHLGEYDATDSIWRIRQVGAVSRAKEDNIVQINAIDAIEEAFGAIWVCMYAPPEAPDVTNLNGVPIPRPDAGSTRESNFRTTSRITPFRGPGGSGFMLSVSVKAVLSPVSFKIFSRMPSFAVRVLMRAGAQEFMQKFLVHLNECRELDARIRSSQHSKFYEAVKNHIASARLQTAEEAEKTDGIGGEGRRRLFSRRSSLLSQDSASEQQRTRRMSWVASSASLISPANPAGPTMWNRRGSHASVSPLSGVRFPTLAELSKDVPADW